MPGATLIEPEPDVAVVPGTPEDYGHAHPSRPVLTVEVAGSSLGLDRYLVDRVLEVYREPLADAAALFGWRYARREVRDASAQVSPLAASVSSIAGAHLLPSPP
jgi:hypothetical protein